MILVMISSTTPVFAGEVDLRMDDSHVSGQSVIARERLLLYAKGASDFLLACIVDCVLMTREVVRSREDGVAGLASGGVDALTFVRPRL